MSHERQRRLSAQRSLNLISERTRCRSAIADAPVNTDHGASCRARTGVHVWHVASVADVRVQYRRNRPLRDIGGLNMSSRRPYVSSPAPPRNWAMHRQTLSPLLWGWRRTSAAMSGPSTISPEIRVHVSGVPYGRILRGDDQSCCGGKSIRVIKEHNSRRYPPGYVCCVVAMLDRRREVPTTLVLGTWRVLSPGLTTNRLPTGQADQLWGERSQRSEEQAQQARLAAHGWKH
jgi:hypothetical protein